MNLYAPAIGSSTHHEFSPSLRYFLQELMQTVSACPASAQESGPRPPKHRMNLARPFLRTQVYYYEQPACGLYIPLCIHDART